jgi:hypothetical protein
MQDYCGGYFDEIIYKINNAMSGFGFYIGGVFYQFSRAE